jgi:Domain of unknown function (DUF4136)
MQLKTRSRSIQLGLALGVALFVSGAALAQDVKYNFMPGTDFSKYHTYKWVTENNGHPDQIVDQQIKQAIDQQLAAKGLTKTDGGDADLFVGYQVSVDNEKQWNAYGGGMGWRMGGGMATATSSTIQVGTLVLDIYDPAAKALVWRGQATKTLNPSKDPQKNQDRINKAMAKLLKNFPPPPPKK